MKGWMIAMGALASAALASLCCIGPVVLSVLGTSVGVGLVRIGLARRRSAKVPQVSDDLRRVCYCFGFTLGDLRRGLAEGRPPVLDEIRRGISEGRCDCRRKNPRGRCCLADVTAAMESLKGGNRC